MVKATTQKVKQVLVAVPVNKISPKNRKMPAKTWDLEAGDTCPGSFDSDGNIVTACEKCYAKKGMFTFPCVRQTRMNNKLAWQLEDWSATMTKALKKEKLFRFFASGDGYHVGLWEKIYEVAVGVPECQIWIPSRMFKFPKFRPIIDKLNQLDNVVVRFSSDEIHGERVEGAQTSTIISSLDELKPGMTLCSAPHNGGQCLDCRACWSKDVQCVAYMLH